MHSGHMPSIPPVPGHDLFYNVSGLSFLDPTLDKSTSGHVPSGKVHRGVISTSTHIGRYANI
eukprot:672390-Karenia_brevis.AAC.1